MKMKKIVKKNLNEKFEKKNFKLKKKEIEKKKYLKNKSFLHFFKDSTKAIY